MRHLKAHGKLGRTTEHRISMLRNLATSLVNSREDRIVTTLPKAKELRPFIEKAITLSRRAASLDGNLPALQRSVRLGPGDLLVIDNKRCAHARSAYEARFDGQDRWLQRAYVRRDIRMLTSETAASFRVLA